MRKRKIVLAMLLVASMAVSAYAQGEKPSVKNEGTVSYEAQTIKSKPEIKDDFYTHMNYEFLTKTKIPEGENSYGNFDLLAKKTQDVISKSIKELNADYKNLKDGSIEKKIVDFYNMAVDFSKRDELGLKPIQANLDKIKNIKSVKGVSNYITANFNKGYGQLVDFIVDKDMKNTTKNAIYIMGSKVGIEKSYYSGKDNFSKKARKAYLNYTKKLLSILGYDKDLAAKRAKEIYNFEKKIVEASLEQGQQMNFDKTYNPVTFKQLGKLAGNFPMQKILKNNGVTDKDKVIVEQPKVLTTLNKLFVKKNVEVIKSLLEVDLLKKNINALSRDVMKAESEYNAVMDGVVYQDTDEESAYNLTDKVYTDGLSKLYVEKNFSPETKKKVLEMAEEVIANYKKRLGEVDWISNSTREKALKKLETMDLKIGYPDQWPDFSSTSVKTYAEGGNLVDAVESMNMRNTKETFDKLSKAPDKKTWSMPAHAVNAAYNPLSNDITFTAAILQAPFYSTDRSDVENLGGIGTVIGHEISHAFDITGAKFDENGNVKNWWTKEDLKKFKEKAKKAAEIYSALEVVKGHNVNGKISTGEIMADLGGMTVALDIAKQKNMDTKKLFESYAAVWRSVNTEEALISNLIDVHPPDKFRVNNIVNLTDEFYKVFNVKEGDGMYVKPEDRLKVW